MSSILIRLLPRGWDEVPRRAVVLGLVIGIVIIGFATVIVWNQRIDRWASALRTGRDVARSLSHDCERSIGSYDLSLMSVANDMRTPGVLQLPADLRDRVLFDSSAKAKYLGPILVVDHDGRVVIDSTAKTPRQQSFAASSLFEHHRAHADTDLLIGHPYRDEAGAYRVALSRRVSHDDGSFAGVVVGTIELAYFEDLFSKLELGAGGVVSLILDDGTLLMRSPHGPTDIGRSLKGTSPFADLLAVREGSIESRAATDGVRRLYVFTQIGRYPLSLAVGQSSASINGSWVQQSIWIALFTLALLTGCGVLAFILQRELINRSRVEAELSAANAKLEGLARDDGLTGLPNRRTFDQALIDLCLRFQRYGEPLALLMIDIDHFKAFNDHFGHPQGDLCIRAVADEIRHCVTRAGDFAARYGGEEFVLLLPATDRNGAMTVAEKLRRSIHVRAIPHVAGPPNIVTVSIGVSVLSNDAPMTAESLVERADEALYAAKRGGRDRVCFDARPSPAVAPTSFGPGARRAP